MNAACRNLSAVTLFLTVGATMFAQAAARSSGKLPCADVTMLDSQPLASLPPKTQIQIRTAVRPAVESIVRDTGMGLRNTKVDGIPLSAIPLAKSTDRPVLYAVSWADSSFGVNAAVWIVEVAPDAAKNLTPASAAVSMWGWGFELLPGEDPSYPEVMIASKGFRAAGGAEAEALCMKKRGAFYESVACPSSCHHNMNSR